MSRSRSAPGLACACRRMRRCSGLLFAAGLLLITRGSSLAKAPPGLPEQLAKALNRPALRCAHLGAMVVGLPHGDGWYCANADRLFLPASNVKLFVAAAALDRLGPEFRYQTALLADRAPDNGVVRGDLFLKGSGDPTLDFAGLADLAQSLRAQGVTRITGRVVGDESAFDSVRYGAGWMYEDLPWYFAPEISALSYSGNAAEVTVIPDSTMLQSPSVEIRPAVLHVEIENNAMTGQPGSPTAVLIERPVGKALIRVSGSIAADSEPVRQRVSIPDPALWAAQTLRQMLLGLGVQVDGDASVEVAPASAVALAEHRSAPLKEIIRAMLNNSDNHMAEQLLKTLGAESSGQGTAQTGLGVVNDFLRRAGIIWGCAPRLADGSGLSRYNLASPRHVAALLRFMDRHPHRCAWLEAFPVAGVSGTLEGRMTQSPAKGIARAKTGTMFAVSALSGYVTTRGGRRACFSILVNNFAAPASDIETAQDDAVGAIARSR